MLVCCCSQYGGAAEMGQKQFILLLPASKAREPLCHGTRKARPPFEQSEYTEAWQSG